MGIIDTSRRQTAVYWPLQGEDSGGSDFDGYGKPLYSDPIEIRVRWEDKNEQILLSDGTTYFSRATITTGIDVVLDGALFLGELTDLTSESDPLSNNGAWPIKKFDKLPNLKNTEILRTAFL